MEGARQISIIILMEGDWLMLAIAKTGRHQLLDDKYNSSAPRAKPRFLATLSMFGEIAAST
jgi:hypothetical protein